MTLLMSDTLQQFGTVVKGFGWPEQPLLPAAPPEGRGLNQSQQVFAEVLRQLDRIVLTFSFQVTWVPGFDFFGLSGILKVQRFVHCRLKSRLPPLV